MLSIYCTDVTIQLRIHDFCERGDCPCGGGTVFVPKQGSGVGLSTRAVGERMSADEHKQHYCDHKVIARSFKPLCTPKNALNWSILIEAYWSFIKIFLQFFGSHLFDFFWNINLKYEMHFAKLQKANKL